MVGIFVSLYCYGFYCIWMLYFKKKKIEMKIKKSKAQMSHWLQPEVRGGLVSNSDSNLLASQQVVTVIGCCAKSKQRQDEGCVCVWGGGGVY